jgi:hypothetical protein
MWSAAATAAARHLSPAAGKARPGRQPGAVQVHEYLGAHGGLLLLLLLLLLCLSFFPAAGQI